MSIISRAYHQQIKDKAVELGFSAIGFARVEQLTKEEQHLKKWLNNNYQADMAYMNNHFEKRVNPALLVDGTKSVISVLLNYNPKELQKDTNAPKIARYAYGKDYHFVIKEKLQQLFDYIKQNIYPELEGRFFTDSAPVLDRAWAVRSGLGWIGKNTNLINKSLGSYTLIGELITNIDLEPDQPINEACGTCQRCIDACPTGALIAPYTLDANKCISYLTIEHKGDIPVEFAGKLENRVFGCDICQEVCPWNKKAPATEEPEFDPHPELLSLSKEEWYNMDNELFQNIFSKSAIKRTKFEGLRRNINLL